MYRTALYTARTLLLVALLATGATQAAQLHDEDGTAKQQSDTRVLADDGNSWGWG